MHFGIDYGSKLAGTTVIAYDTGGRLELKPSQKKQDADAMITAAIDVLKPAAVYIDAPLSLPQAYYGHGDDFFYRAGDKEIGAMSPMFLGGLTARAIRLSSQIDVRFHEVYPGGLVKKDPALATIYSKKDQSCIPGVLQVLTEQYSAIPALPEVTDLHQLDALIAWIIGWKHQQGLVTAVGAPDEGVIYF